MPENPTTVLGAGFNGRVSTAAGSAGPGEADGTGPEVNRLFSLVPRNRVLLQCGDRHPKSSLRHDATACMHISTESIMGHRLR